MNLDWSAIIVGLIALIGSVFSNLAIAKRKSQADAIKDMERETRQQDRMISIEKKLDEHNHYADKLGSIEKSIVAIQKDIEYLKSDKCKL